MKLTASLIGLMLLAPIVASQERPLPPLTNVGIDQRLDAQVPLELVFRDETGTESALARYFTGKPVVLILVYYGCPGLCSRSLDSLTDSLRGIAYEIGKDFEVLTVSFDPREKPTLAAAKKKTYLESYGRAVANDGWHFLTGDEVSTTRLAEAVGFRFVFDPGTGQFQHASGIMVLTPEGKISRYFYGLDYPSRDLRFALEDASEGKIGSPVTRPLRLLCYVYDPTSGRYSFIPLRLVQAGGVLTLFTLGAYVVFQLRRERRGSRTVSASE
jgi:protein SCO1